MRACTRPDLLGAERDVVLAVERRTTFNEEDEKVVLAEDRVMRASKDLPLDLAHGEFIGLAKLTRTGARRLWEEIDGLIRAGNVTAYLTEAFERVQRAACRSVPSSPLAAPGVTTTISVISRPRARASILAFAPLRKRLAPRQLSRE